ncbi:hypothetical protein ED733_002302 [Metarhizium rileyi]|uniref:diphosphoinositol-polyphosphate diphosphatase n=1 Tax=Metarhizium rileyi (strain RCEF 4871) TaxID=1649241 RepID=A0A5C6GC84_METRR|nr:hypothetical protein ED733_002302 [Metarhizium rileyi]
MAYKRNSHSLEHGLVQSAQEMRETQQSSTINWEPQTAASRSHSLTPSDKDVPPSSSPTRQFENSVASMSAASSVSDSSDCPTSAFGGRPTNFGVVVPGLYRSSYPKPENYDFLASLGLKTVVTLVKKDELDHDLDLFLTSNGIRQVTFNMKGTKKEAIPLSTMRAILELVLDRKNYPLMLHCNHGKHRTGCVVAAVRKLSGWRLDTVIDEYKAYAEPKAREFSPVQGRKYTWVVTIQSCETVSSA